MSGAAARQTGQAAQYTFGPRAHREGGVVFRLWAPSQRQVKLRLVGRDDAIVMRSLDDGWHEAQVRSASPGTRYSFELGDGLLVPDPASRYQPEDVHGPSEWLDTSSFEFKVRWHGRPWHEMVLYELHIGTFTPEGTFRSAIEKLDHLAHIGITGIEVMPVGDFAGRRNWGYDGVLPFAPDSAYGKPEHFAELIDAAHERGISVLLDVVYNHFGPEGNYLAHYAPGFFTERHHTRWGAGLGFDAADARLVREYFVENALFWLREYRLDGLRVDAVHAMRDASGVHIATELAARVRREIRDRPVHLVVENEDNNVRWLARRQGEPEAFTAQWNDDIHHVLHVAATGESASYYEDYKNNTELLARALAEGFAFQGEVMRHRGTPRGEPSRSLPPTAFVSFIQNHDQIGNRAFGERLGHLVTRERLRAVAAVYLLAPQVPMLFMGEEWNARQPFRFFCDFTGELADAVRRGRREEFPQFPEKIPDPQDVRTFEQSKLHWDDVGRFDAAEWLHWYERVLAVRRARIVPLLPQMTRAGDATVLGPGAVSVRWRSGDRTLHLVTNLSSQPVESPLAASTATGRVLWHEGSRGSESVLPPWCVRWSVED